MRDSLSIRRAAPAALLIILVAAFPGAFSLAATEAQGQAQAQGQSQAKAAPAVAQSPEQRVDALFAPWNNLNTPGAAVTVVKDGMVVYRKGFGCAQLEYGIPITPSTVFHVASVSKQFTAMAITLLEAAGKLSADDDIHTYLPELHDFGATVTIQNLLNHTSGIRDQWDLLALSGWRMDDVITQGQIMDRLRRQKELNFAPGSRYMYSNSGFTLLAEIVSRVSGKPFTEWTRENIFQPLGMTSTHFHIDNTEIVRDRAYSYNGDREHGFKQAGLNYANVGATSLFTTVEDMANWLRNFEDKRVGGSAVMDKMLTKGVLADGNEISYARGIEIGAYRGLKTVGHSGGDAGFRSHVVYFPGERFGVAVFSNLGSVDPGGLSLRIAEIYLASRLERPKAGGPAPVALKPITLPVKSLEPMVGPYLIESSQLLRKIIVRKDKLIYFRSDESQTVLQPLSATRFRMLDIGGEVYVDFSDKAGDVYNTYTVTEADGRKVEAKRIEPYEPTEAQLKEFLGSFYSDELDTRYDLTLKSGSIWVTGQGHQEGSPLGPIGRDSFSAGGYFGLKFERNGRGAISGFRISTGRVLNLKFVKVK
jgi:CubicO group peptidase (beta-lactamase class C family)